MKYEGLDQKIIHAFTMGYWNLHKAEKISDEELDEVLNLIDKLESYTLQETEKKLSEIFKKHPQ